MDRIGRYRIIGELGRGAMGVVYHATDPAIGRSVAIKIIRIRDIGDTVQRDKLRERLFREARSAGVLSHPNIVTIYDMDEVDGLAYIAMAYVNGPTLEKILASREPLSGTRMLRLLRQTASALDYAHSRGIVHRDVKPANIMTDEDGAVKITDFGIAKITSGANVTDTRTVVGTPNYMSPEQVQGLEIDGRSDQFSLAVIAYEILTGERPFQGEHLSTIVYRIVAEDPEAAQRINGTLTAQIDSVLRRALAKKPAERYPNCSSFVGALEMACAESRGWKTLAAGSAASMPTLGVERPAAPPPPPAANPPIPQRPVQLGAQINPPINPQVALPPRPIPNLPERPVRSPSGDDRPPRRRSAFWPLLVLVLALLVIAAAIAWQAGGIPGVVAFGPRQEASAPAAEAPPANLPPATAEPSPAASRSTADKTGTDKTDADKPNTDKADHPDSDATTALKADPDKPGNAVAEAQNPPAEPAVVPPVAPPVVPLRDSGGRRSPFQTNRQETATANAAPASRNRLQDIWVTTNPPGAKVVLDDNLSQPCQSPCMQHGLPGVHHLTISQAGFLNEYREIHVGDSAQDVPTINLRQPGGTLMLNTVPPGASIRINGQLISQVTPAAISLKPGSYSVTVEKGGQSQTQRIDVQDSPVYVRIPLGQ